MTENEQWTNNGYNAKYGSPLTSKQLKACLCFANLKNNKPTYQLHTPRSSKAKGNENTSKKQKENVAPFTQCSIKDNNKIIIQTYQIQNQSLKDTVSVLKEQVAALQNGAQMLREQYSDLQEEVKRKDQALSLALGQLDKYKSREQENAGIESKIEELQQLQDKMIVENQYLKQRQSKLKKLLGNILIAIGSSTDHTSTQIKSLINQTCNQL